LLLPLHAPHHSHAAIAQPTCGRTLPSSGVGSVILVVRPAPGVFPLFPPKRQQRWRSGRWRAWTRQERHARLPETVTAPAAPAAHVQLHMHAHKQNTHHSADDYFFEPGQNGQRPNVAETGNAHECRVRTGQRAGCGQQCGAGQHHNCAPAPGRWPRIFFFQAVRDSA